jgi:hypothetical protein
MILLSVVFLYNLLQVLGGNPQIVEQEGAYTKFALTDSTTMEVYEADSILVVFTACAPQCSSCARIYNKEWKLISTITPPFPSIFPLAHIENGRIIWTDNDTWSYQSTL